MDVAPPRDRDGPQHTRTTPRPCRTLTNDTIAYFWGAYAKGYRFHNQHQATYNTYDYTGSLNFNPTSTLSSKTSLGVQYYTRHDAVHSGRGRLLPGARARRRSASAGTKVGLHGRLVRQQHARLLRAGAARLEGSAVRHGRGARGQQQLVRQGREVGWLPEGEHLVRRQRGAVGPGHACRDLLNSLRLRAAYGASGQQPALNTALQTLSPVAGPERAGRADAEHARQPGSQAGARRRARARLRDGMFSDRFGIDFTYFHDKSKDAILSRGVAPSTRLRRRTTSSSTRVRSRSRASSSASRARSSTSATTAWDVNFTLGTHSSKIDRLNGTDTTIDLGTRTRTASGTRRSTGSRTRC